jgi:hypothetical protein
MAEATGAPAAPAANQPATPADVKNLAKAILISY